MSDYPPIHPDCLPGKGSRNIKKQIGTLRHSASLLSQQYEKATTEQHRHKLRGKCKRIIAAADSLQAVLDLNLHRVVIDQVQVTGESFSRQEVIS